MADTAHGGNTFPTTTATRLVGELGIKLRDYFATQSLAGHRAANHDGRPEEVSAQAYRDADAMLAARNGGE